MVGSGVSIHGVKEIAKVTSHNFWLRSGKKDRLASMGELEGTNPVRIRQRIVWSEEKQTWEGNLTLFAKSDRLGELHTFRL